MSNFVIHKSHNMLYY